MLSFWAFIFTGLLLCFCTSVRTNSNKEPVADSACDPLKSFVNNCGFLTNRKYFENGQTCMFQEGNFSQVEYVCSYGNWIKKDTGIGNIHVREKRQVGEVLGAIPTFGAELGMAIGGPVGAAIGGLAGSIISGIICIFACKGPDPQPPHEAPKIHCEEFQIQKQYTAEPGNATYKINIGPFKTKEGLTVATIPPSPITLRRGKNMIIFKVADSLGFEKTCDKSVELIVPTCDQPDWPDKGFVRCSRSEVLVGDSCTVSCQGGYEVQGKSTLTCSAGGKYDSSQAPACSVVRCKNSTSISPLHGHAHCDDLTFAYGTVCVTECDEGFGTRSSRFTKCKDTKSWSDVLPPCEDNEPPVFKNCPTSIHVSADENKDTAKVSWIQPVAEDNSGQTPTVKQIRGDPPGSDFGQFTEIAYVATDAKHNTSPKCTFFIIVEKKFCAPPVFNGDQYLYYTCGKKGYQYGSSCDLHCKGSYPLVGNNKMTCKLNSTSNEMYWDWGTQGRPFCKQNKCPALTAPKNGALACDKWMYGTQCTMQCNDQYDIPLGVGGSSTFTGLLTCSTAKGVWSPLTTVPDCTVKRMGHNHRIPGELVFSGDCNDKATQNQIKQNFVALMQKLQADPGYAGVCPNVDMCNIENVEVICGASKKRRRSVRSADEITLTFEFVRKYESFGNGSMGALNHAKQQFAVLQSITTKLVNQGLMDVPNATIDKTSLQFGEVDIDCGPGRFPKYSTLTCGACAKGSYLHTQTQKCTNCPIGFYKTDEDAVNCTMCPQGQTTETEGATSIDDCKEICQPGYFSQNGLDPCIPCRLGSYSSVAAAKTCEKCDENTLTTKTSSTRKQDCKAFDVALSQVDVSVPLQTSSDIQSLSISLWINLAERSSLLDLTIGGGNGLNLQISSRISLTYGSQNWSTNLDINRQSWSHVVVVLKSSGTINVYKNGISKILQTVSLRPLTSRIMRLKTTRDFAVSGLILTHREISNQEIKALSQSCIANVSGTILTMDDIRNSSSKGITVVVPSKCDATDECAPNPCNGHKCQDSLGGFTCLCSGGFTGTKCEVKPNFCAENNCENGATCINGANNYTCMCADRYSGVFCENFPVDGKWSDWSMWKPCSKTCGGGTTTRYRNCTNPAPGPNGRPCTGSAMESDVCNSDACPTCPRPPSAYGVRMSCNTTALLKTCSASCRAGLTFAPGHLPLDQYKCGRETNYEWNGHPPSCTRVSVPSSFAIQSSFPYSNFPCGQKDSVLKEVHDNAKSGLQCGRNNTCVINVKLQGCGSRRKRSGNAQVTVTLTIPMDNGDLKLDQLETSNIVSPALVKAIKALADLEASAQEINRTGKIFQVNGINVKINTQDVQISNVVKCQPGTIRAGTFCVDCPTGTFNSQKDICEPCQYGKYQDLTGQASCKSCPNGYTTAYMGSKGPETCSVKKLEETNNGANGGSSSTTIIIAAVVSTTVLVTVAVVTVLLLRKFLRKQNRKKLSGSSISLNMVKPNFMDSARPGYYK